jgi:hypothetical protein
MVNAKYRVRRLAPRISDSSFRATSDVKGTIKSVAFYRPFLDRSGNSCPETGIIAIFAGDLPA